MTRHTERLPITVFDETDDGFGEVDVAFDWTPGTSPSGLSGSPENYDPGSGDEFYIVGAGYVCKDGTVGPFMLCAEWEEKIADYLDENWERPDDEGALAEYRYEQWRDEQMEKRA